MKKDRILIAALIAAGLLFGIILLLTRSQGAYVEVRINGEAVRTISLDCSGEYTINGGSNLLVIDDGCAYMSEADCPDKLCVNMGKIRYSGQSIVCLPNKVVIEIIGGEDNPYQTDAVAGGRK